MRLDHGFMPFLRVSVLLVTDDYGNEISFSQSKDAVRAYLSFDNAKRFVYGLSFEEMEYRTLYPVHEEH